MPVILVVDDDPVLRKLYKDEFEELGYNVILADGKNALEVFFSNTILPNTIDCVVTDMLMPGTDGFQFLREIREKDKKMPVIINSCYDYFDDIKFLSPDEYVTKSADTRGLIEAVRKYMQV